jgi:hypothetical protein
MEKRRLVLLNDAEQSKQQRLLFAAYLRPGELFNVDIFLSIQKMKKAKARCNEERIWYDKSLLFLSKEAQADQK